MTGEDFDDVIGFLHVRDLLGIAETDQRTVGEVSRPVLMLPATKMVLPSVTTMRQEGTHLAVVVDEYGGTDGIVTLEDLVEEIVGDIRDEYDAGEPDVGADLSQLDGGMTIEDFAEVTGIRLEDGGYDTVAGLIIAGLGHIPAVGEAVYVESVRIEVTTMSGSRIIEVSVVEG